MLRTAKPGVAVKSRRLTNEERADLLIEYWLAREQGNTAHEAAKTVGTTYVTLNQWEHAFGLCLREIAGDHFVCDKATRKVECALSEVA